MLRCGLLAELLQLCVGWQHAFGFEPLQLGAALAAEQVMGLTGFHSEPRARSKATLAMCLANCV